MYRPLSFGLLNAALVPKACAATEDMTAGGRSNTRKAVKRPAVYRLNGANSPVEALALAKGLDGNIPSRVAIFRTIKGQKWQPRSL